MNQDFLKSLRKIALYFKLEVGPKYGGAIDVDSLSKVLKAINSSFQSYFDAELRNQVKGKISSQVDKEIKTLRDEARLLIVDLKFASFEAALSPDAVTSTAYAHIQHPLQTKREIFKSFEQDIFFSNLNDVKTVERIEKKFTKEVRAAIFKPLEETVFNPTKYSFKYGKSFNDLTRKFKPIRPEISKRLIPPSVKPPSLETVYKVYVVTEGEYDLFGPKPKIKKMLASEKLDRLTYPLQLSKIKGDDTEIIFKNPITAEVTYDEEENLYHITYNELNIAVWDKDRNDADEAFRFAFISLVKNFYVEKDIKLTESGKQVKYKLASLIDQIK